MTDATEAAASKQEFAADLKAGIDTLGKDQVITFTLYVKLVLPLDGYVFWVKADLVSPGALYNAAAFNAAAFGKPMKVVTPAKTLDAQGSLHWATTKTQDEDSSVSTDQMVFTSEVEVNDLNLVGPALMYIATVGENRFAFSQRGSFYIQSDVYHYRGFSLYSVMDTQVIDRLDGFDGLNIVVSNSLPLWLALNGYRLQFDDRFTPIPMMLYPSFAVPDNLPPPYASVHVVPDSTEGMQSAPVLGPTLTHTQLCSETVRVTLYGLRNWNAMNFVDCVNQYTLDTEAFGISNIPVLRDQKRTQVELGILAQKKIVEYKINYNQQAARDLARQLILSCIPNYYLGELVAA